MDPPTKCTQANIASHPKLSADRVLVLRSELNLHRFVCQGLAGVAFVVLGQGDYRKQDCGIYMTR